MKNRLLKVKGWLISTKHLTYATGRWFKKKHLWSIILIPLLIVPAFILASKAFTLYAVILQGIGAIIIIWGVNNRLKESTKESLLRNLKNDFSKFPPVQRKRNVNVKMEGAGITITANPAHAFATKNKDSFKDISEVVEYFNKQVTELNTRIGRVHKELSREISTSSNKLLAIQNENKNEIHRIKKGIEDSNTSNVYLDVFGASCLIIGLILTAIQQLNSL